MSILNIVKTVKEIHKEEIVFVKIGKFYQVYGKDAYVMVSGQQKDVLKPQT